jgi:ABC-type polysaccharide/polyol phosphate transport system ATPase subunit
VNAIEFHDVSKRFKMREERVGSFRATVVDRLRGRWRPEVFWAVRDLSLDIESGETVAIIGSNGSGKSTILKLVARILEPTTGDVVARGSVSALLELGAGFHADFTGRENIYLFGSFQGLSSKEVAAHYNEIVAFSELGSFVDQPVKHFSSGMYLRLAFSAAIVLDPDILLIDEMLAVGDERFQHKCLERFKELRSRGKTIVIVTHDLRKVQEVCSRAVWIERGACLADGHPDAVVAAYLESVADQERRGRAVLSRALAGSGLEVAVR